MLKATLLLAALATTGNALVTVGQSTAAASAKEVSLCGPPPEEALLMGLHGVHLGAGLAAIPFPVKKTSGPSNRNFDEASVETYQSSGAFGTHPGLTLETASCLGTEIIVGITKTFGHMMAQSVANWEVAAHNNLRLQTGQAPRRSLEGNRIVYRAIKARAPSPCEACVEAVLELSQSCRINSQNRTSCAFTNSAFYFVLSTKKQE